MGYETIGASEESCFESRTRRARRGRKEGERKRVCGAELAKMLRRLRLPSAVLRGLLTSKLKHRLDDLKIMVGNNRNRRHNLFLVSWVHERREEMCVSLFLSLEFSDIRYSAS
jgi:hypothetical protein